MGVLTRVLQFRQPRTTRRIVPHQISQTYPSFLEYSMPTVSREMQNPKRAIGISTN
ncbi:uncharacterized protein EI90DRAFT_3040956, partial [Cantharellus anzutake]|uniref:uncharacterized protein n=1 Tax=Cantharellus anzutake TaxID=1750568 RepID=UPI0019047E4C